MQPAETSADTFVKREFRIMGTPSELLLRTDEETAERLFDKAHAELERIEAAFTRFRPDSPIERFNDAGGGEAWPELRELLLAAQRAWSDTDGRFDISIGSELIAAGYDRDFAELEPPTDTAREAWSHAPRTMDRVLDWTRGTGYAIDDNGMVTLDPGVRLDLGGLAKGWASDRICAMLRPAGSCLVNLGGDIALHVAEGDEQWPIGVERGDATTLSIAVPWGGVATSGQDRRVWKVAGSDTIAHHVIDPASGRSADTDILRVTVVAATCMEAEVWAKALFMVGAEAAQAEADRREITSVIVDFAGTTRYSGSLKDL